MGIMLALGMYRPPDHRVRMSSQNQVPSDGDFQYV